MVNSTLEGLLKGLELVLLDKHPCPEADLGGLRHLLEYLPYINRAYELGYHNGRDAGFNVGLKIGETSERLAIRRRLDPEKHRTCKFAPCASVRCMSKEVCREITEVLVSDNDATPRPQGENE